ncbi:MAG: MarR family transcriptional regulator [Pseudomonadota bacterium]
MPDIEIARLVDRFMRRINASLNAKASTFDHHRVGPHGGILLLTLAEIEPARLQDLALIMARDKGQMSRGVQALERKGLIERIADPADARASLLRLTSEGRETVITLEHAVAEAIDRILTPLSDVERRALKALLQAV